MPNISHWSLDDGYESKVLTQNEYPYRTFRLFRSLAIDLHTKKENLHNSSQYRNGFSIFFKQPGETRTYPFYEFEILKRISILVKPKFVTTSEKLRSYSPSIRRCFFNSERKLRFYQIYTEDNCIYGNLRNYLDYLLN